MTDEAQAEPQVRDTLPMWVIYKNPTDAPDHYVVRRHSMLLLEGGGTKNQPDLVAQYAETLEQARALIPEGLVNLGRHPEEDPWKAIEEVWI